MIENVDALKPNGEDPVQPSEPDDYDDDLGNAEPQADFDAEEQNPKEKS